MRAIAIAIGAWALVAAWPAGAEVVALQPGPEGEDTSPYGFLPLLVRGDRETLWATSDPVDGHGFETFVRFELPGDLLGPDEKVGQALLSLYYALDSSGQGSGTDDPGVLECRAALSAWSEMAVTWTAKPAYGPPVDVVDGIAALGPLLCDVTDLVADWATGAAPNHGFALTNPTGRLLGFYSFEAAVDPGLKPALFIDVVPVPEPGASAGAIAAAAALGAAAVRRGRGAA